MFTATHILSDRFKKEKSPDSALTKEEAAHLLAAYIRYVKKPTLIIGENVYDYIVEEKAENNTKWTSSPANGHASVHRQLTIWGFDALFRDQSSSITNLSGKLSPTAKSYIYAGSVEPDKDEVDMMTINNELVNTYLGHFCSPQLKNKFNTSDPTAYTRFNAHYYNAITIYDWGDYKTAYNELGRALHYLEDITSPPHAALITGNRHSDYEHYARDRVLSSSKLLTTIPSSTYSYMKTTRGEDMCRSFATVSNNYAYIVDLGVLDVNKKAGTKECLHKAQRIVAGLGYRYLEDTERLW